MRCLTILMFLCVLVARPRAQETNGIIAGSVRDTQGAVVPGVVVVALNSSGLKAEALTDGLGRYRFPVLPPDEYELAALLADFIKGRVPGIHLPIGAELTVDLVLEAAGPNVTVEVVGRSPFLAVTQSARVSSLHADEIERMPRGRDFGSLAFSAAGVTAEAKLGGLSIDGASSAENRVMIDGMETTDTQLGLPGLSLSTDFIAEIQVKSSGYEAEFGGSTGGVVNVVTRSGGNAYHGRAIGYLSTDGLDAALRPTLRLEPDDPARAGYVTFPEDRYSDIVAGLTVGGSLLPGRLWFFAGYLPTFRSTIRETHFLADGTTRSFDQQTYRQDIAANATTQLGKKARARSIFNLASQVTRGLLPALDGTGNPDANYAVHDIAPAYSASANLDFTGGTRFLVSGRAGYFSKDSYNERVYRGARIAYMTSSLGLNGVPLEYQHARGYANVPSNFGRERGKGTHFHAQIGGAAFFRTAGEHQLKSGVQIDRVGLDTFSGATGKLINVFWNQSFMGQRGPGGYYRVLSNDRFPDWGPIVHGESAVTNVGVFVQDSWRITRQLTVQLGLRTESEHVPSLSPDPRIPDIAIRFGFADKLAPRLGLAWDATADGGTKVFGSWGFFYDITKLQLSTAFGAFSSIGYAFTLDGADIGTIAANPNCPPACPGVRIDGPRGVGPPLNDPANSHIDPELRQTRLHEAVVGLERQVASNMTVAARYVRKRVHRAMEDIGTQRQGQSTTSVMIGNPGFGIAREFFPDAGGVALPLPPARRDYDAVEIGLERRMSGRWSGSASYGWSRLSGNYSGLVQSDEKGRVAPNTGRAFDHPMMSFDEEGQAVYGALATDRPHRMKARVLVDCGFGLSLGVHSMSVSGVPRTREAAFLPGQNVAVMYRGRGSDGRLSALSQTDVHVQYRTRLTRGLALTLSATAMNLLNQDTAIDYFPTELFENQAIAVDESTFYSGIDTQRLIEAQQLVRDPRFLLDSAYQVPRAIRLGVALDF